MASLFVNAPQEVSCLVDSLGRLDMLDYYASSLSRGVPDQLDAKVYIKEMTESTVTFTTSNVSERSFALLPHGKDTLVMVVETVSLPIPDSSATVYTLDWKKAGKAMQLPDFNDLSLWLTGDWKEKIDDIENAVKFVTASISWDKDTQSLTVINTTQGVVSRESQELVTKYMKPSIAYRWTGRKWNKI